MIKSHTDIAVEAVVRDLQSLIERNGRKRSLYGTISLGLSLSHVSAFTFDPMFGRSLLVVTFISVVDVKNIQCYRN